MAAYIKVIARDGKNDKVKPDLLYEADILRDLHDVFVSDIIRHQARIDDIIESVKTAESIVQQSGQSIVKEATGRFVERIMATVNQFSNQVKKSNGFWFCLGAFLFFVIPAIAFSLNLSKYFCRMQWEQKVTEVPVFAMVRSVEPERDYTNYRKKRHREEYYTDLQSNDLPPNDLPLDDLTPTYINPYYEPQFDDYEYEYEPVRYHRRRKH
ncbi:hypothetical protein NP493_183g00023 [Ridgeia piscesae]|uniref:Uncharacterized protein n=1 Tax=Ridgeia piscesae TaxID=27915 RepID=A0AAD9P2I4_RIDPI|nr:hypothetical protein NP493_183g00023 [Ridgeia piscesae]